jgi:PKD repeat protein
MKSFVNKLGVLLLLSPIAVNAQKPVFDASNARDGETVEYCIQHKKNNALMQNPAYVQSLVEDEIIRQKESNGGVVPKGTIYKIPVVFHVLHNNGVENISDEQIYDALEIINRDYRLLNADANNVQAEFDGVVTQGTFEPQPSDVEIEFVLATKAPDGTCFKGITRTANSISYNGANGDNQVDAIIAGNDVFNGQWPGNKYMNVFICGEIGGAAGYTMKPSNWVGTSMYNGIWVLHNYVGSIGTSSVGTSRTLTHEAGHWLNLDHTWGGNNNPGNTTSCSSDDAVQDTPNCIGVTSCALNSNTCTSDNNFFGFPIRDNVENYMDYSYCSKMFTQGQVNRMRSAVTSSVGGRNNLWTAANLNATGATGTLTLCKAEFTSNKTSVCVGDQVEFYDDTYNAVSGWSWSFPSGTPSTSTVQNPIVTYNTPGVYEVTLTATNAGNSDTETKTGYIRVLPASTTLPFFEGFESYSSLNNLTNWEVYNPNNNNAFSITNTTSHSGAQCVKLTNFGQSGANSDELIASAVDLSDVASSGGVVTLSFRYAYRKRASSNIEWLKVFITNDCGSSWVQRKTLSGSQLSSQVATTAWTPSAAADWTTVHMVNVTSDYWVDNFRYKFEFEGNNGNNFYLDDINIYLGSPSDDIVLGLGEAGEIANLEVYPNPTDGELNVTFSSPISQQATLTVRDIAGKLLQQNSINAASGSNLVMLGMDSLAAGTYFVTVNLGDSQKTLQVTVK